MNHQPHLFAREAGKYLATEDARGGWDLRTVHGAPVCALLAHGLESALRNPAMFLARGTFDLLAQVLYEPIELKTSVVREGRRIAVVDCHLTQGDKLVARASGMLLRRVEGMAEAVTLPARPPAPSWKELVPREFPENLLKYDNLQKVAAERPLYHRFLDIRYTTEPYVGHPMVAWIRNPFTLLPELPLSPFARTAICAEFINGLGQTSRDGYQGFTNGDVTLYLSRELEGEWLRMESTGRSDVLGVELSSANLFDPRGYIGFTGAGAVAADNRNFSRKI